VPPGQPEQAVPFKKEPAGQGVHVVKLAWLYDPLVQDVQATAAEAENVPTTQLWQLRLVPFKKEPAGQGVHVVKLASLYEPLVQGVQATAEDAENVPPAQVWHALALAFRYVPAEQAEQAVGGRAVAEVSGRAGGAGNG